MFPFKVIFLLALVTFLTRISDALPPEPVGPYYGFPYKPSVAKNLIIPSTSYGKCEVRSGIFVLYLFYFKIGEIKKSGKFGICKFPKYQDCESRQST